MRSCTLVVARIVGALPTPGLAVCKKTQSRPTYPLSCSTGQGHVPSDGPGPPSACMLGRVLLRAMSGPVPEAPPAAAMLFCTFVRSIWLTLGRREATAGKK